jgi:glutathione synthase
MIFVISTLKKTPVLLCYGRQRKRGYELYYAEQDDLFIRDGRAYGQLKPLQVFENYQQWQQLGEPAKIWL